MGIDHDSFIFRKSVTENDVRRLSADARQRAQFLHRSGNFSVVFGGDSLARAEDTFGFASEEAGGADFALERFRFRLGEGAGVAIFSEQQRCNHVHPLIRALRAQNCRNQELQWVREIEFAMGVRVDLAKSPGQSESTFARGHPNRNIGVAAGAPSPFLRAEEC